MSLLREKFKWMRHAMITTAELARNTNDTQDFFDAIPLWEPMRTSRELTTLAIAHRAFREASTAPLAALLADRHRVRAIR